MARVLLLGSGPLPHPAARELTAGGFRLQQFRRVLAAEGHRLRCLMLMPQGERWQGVEDDVHVVTWPALSKPSLIRRICRTFRPDAVVTAGSYHAHFAVAHVPSGIPVWSDMAGDLFAEAQAKAAATGEEVWRRHYLPAALSALARADRLSSVSRRQRFALLGELGVVGRLSGRTAGYEFVTTMPVCFPDVSVVGAPRAGPPWRIYVGGSFNHWSDVPLLVELMASLRAAHVTWVLSGGRVPGYNDKLYHGFLATLAAKGLTDRLEAHGYLPYADLPHLLASCHFGLTLDAPWYESELGSRNRILFALAAGLPYVTTPGCELVDELEQYGVVALVKENSLGAAQAAVLEMQGAWSHFRSAVARARPLLADRFDAPRSAAPLLAWAADPRVAPDQPFRSRISTLSRLAGTSQKVRAILPVGLDPAGRPLGPAQTLGQRILRSCKSVAQALEGVGFLRSDASGARAARPEIPVQTKRAPPRHP